MSTRQTLVVGGVLALLAGLLVDHGAHLGAQVVQTALLGTALGAVLGLVTSHGPIARSLSFTAGFAFAWVGFALRAGFLPDIPAGRAIATAAVVVLITATAALSGGRLPLVAGLLGAAAMTGAYEFPFASNPTAFTTESVTAATTALLCASLGFLATEILTTLTAARPHVQTENELVADSVLAQPAAPAADVALPKQRSSHDSASRQKASR